MSYFIRKQVLIWHITNGVTPAFERSERYIQSDTFKSVVIMSQKDLKMKEIKLFPN